MQLRIDVVWRGDLGRDKGGGSRESMGVVGAIANACMDFSSSNMLARIWHWMSAKLKD